MTFKRGINGSIMERLCQAGRCRAGPWHETPPWGRAQLLAGPANSRQADSPPSARERTAELERPPDDLLQTLTLQVRTLRFRAKRGHPAHL